MGSVWYRYSTFSSQLICTNDFNICSLILWNLSDDWFDKKLIFYILLGKFQFPLITSKDTFSAEWLEHIRLGKLWVSAASWVSRRFGGISTSPVFGERLSGHRSPMLGWTQLLYQEFQPWWTYTARSTGLQLCAVSNSQS